MESPEGTVEAHGSVGGTAEAPLRNHMTMSFREFRRDVTVTPVGTPVGPAADLSPISGPKSRLSGFVPAKSRVFSTAVYRSVIKRTLDIALVLVSAVIVVPVVAILALLIARDGQPSFYAQTRIGRGGKPFKMWKLRSMVVDADARLAAHLAADPIARAEWDRDQKLKNDPRITPLGRILRKTSLDELPQLWNVLRGDMSLVGPRPIMENQVALYPGEAYHRHRPGVTGNWQVSDRNASSFQDRARFDAQYDRTLSFLTDLWIILRTVRVVVRGTGY